LALERSHRSQEDQQAGPKTNQYLDKRGGRISLMNLPSSTVPSYLLTSYQIFTIGFQLQNTEAGIKGVIVNPYIHLIQEGERNHCLFCHRLAKRIPT
jgi:hypothetical protein